MKKSQTRLLLTITVVFAAFTLGLFLGRNMNHGGIQLSVASAVTPTRAPQSTQLWLAAESAAPQASEAGIPEPGQTTAAAFAGTGTSQSTRPPEETTEVPASTIQLPGETTPPVTEAATAGAANPEDSGLININTATRAQLESLPGIGEVLAQRIIDYRDANGPFTSVTQLTRVSGIGEKRLAAIIDLITV